VETSEEIDYLEDPEVNVRIILHSVLNKLENEDLNCIDPVQDRENGVQS